MHAVKAAGEKEMAEAVARAESVRAKESAESQEKFRALEKTSDDTRFRYVTHNQAWELRRES